MSLPQTCFPSRPNEPLNDAMLVNGQQDLLQQLQVLYAHLEDESDPDPNNIPSICTNQFKS